MKILHLSLVAISFLLVSILSDTAFGSDPCPAGGYIHYGPSRQSVPCYMVSAQSNPTLEDQFGNLAQTKVAHDGTILVLNQTATKMVYKSGENITINAELVNIGNTAVTIGYCEPLVAFEIKNQTGSEVWPNSQVACIPELTGKKTLQPGEHANVQPWDSQMFPNAIPHPRLYDPGNYTVLSVALFSFDTNTGNLSSVEPLWSQPLHITISSEKYTQNKTDSTNSTMPKNAIRTPDGGWITPLQTTDQNGNNLTIHYETGIQVSGYANPGPPPDPIFLTDSRGNNENFLTNHQILIRADAYLEYPDTKTMDIEINMTSDTGYAFDSKRHLTFEPNDTHMQQIVWQFTPTKAGNYTIEKFSDGIHTSSTFFSVSDSNSSSNSPILVSPLRQYKWGILPSNIQCQNSLMLVFKVEDGSPACIEPQNVTKLQNWGWARPIISTHPYSPDPDHN